MSRLGFDAEITYSAHWSESGEEWTQREGFLTEEDFTGYLKVMEWRIIKAEKISA